jgi:hypothetical protein
VPRLFEIEAYDVHKRNGDFVRSDPSCATPSRRGRSQSDVMHAATAVMLQKRMGLERSVTAQMYYSLTELLALSALLLR